MCLLESDCAKRLEAHTQAILANACISICTFAFLPILTHWGRMTHICVSKQSIIGSDNGLSPGRRQAIIWTNAWILLSGTLGTNFSEILIAIRIFSFTKIGLKVSSAKWQPFQSLRNLLYVTSQGSSGKKESLVPLNIDWSPTLVHIFFPFTSHALGLFTKWHEN